MPWDYRFEPDYRFRVSSTTERSQVAEFALGYELEARTIVLMQVLLVDGLHTQVLRASLLIFNLELAITR